MDGDYKFPFSSYTQTIWFQIWRTNWSLTLGVTPIVKSWYSFPINCNCSAPADWFRYKIRLSGRRWSIFWCNRLYYSGDLLCESAVSFSRVMDRCVWWWKGTRITNSNVRTSVVFFFNWTRADGYNGNKLHRSNTHVCKIVRTACIWLSLRLWNAIIWCLFMTYYRFVTRLTRQVPLVEQELLILPENLSSTPVLSRVHVTRSLVLYVCFVYRCLSFWPLSCLSFFNLRIFITLLVSSNSS